MPDTTLQSLVDDLASPDAAVRDDRAYAALARLVRDGGLDADDRAVVRRRAGPARARPRGRVGSRRGARRRLLRRVGAAGVGGPGSLLEALARRLMAPTGDVRSELAPLTKRFTALGTPVSATWMSGTLGGSDTVILVALGQSPPVRGIPSRRAATHHLHPHGPASVRGIPSRRQAT